MSSEPHRPWQQNLEMSYYDGPPNRNHDLAPMTQLTYDGYVADTERPRQQATDAKAQKSRTWASLFSGLFTSRRPYSTVNQQGPSSNAQYPRQASIDPIDSWGVHWFTPASMTVLLFLGLGGAVGHHIYYSSLNNQQAGTAAQQQWVTRIGTALAFLTQATLSAAVLISRNQRVWVSLRGKFLSLYTIDALFNVTDNLFHFINGEMIAHAKTVTMMALVRWIIPISAIFTPGTISVMSTVDYKATSCVAPTIRFPYEESNMSQLVNSSSTNSSATKAELSENWRVIYRSPSALAKKIFTLSAYSGDIAAGVPDVEGATLPLDCGPNCTYAISFEGPTLDCTEEIPWDSGRAPWHHDLSFIPDGEGSGYPYVARTLGTEFTAMMGYSPENSTANDTTATADVLWIGHRIVLSTDSKLPVEKMYEPHVYSCQNFVGTYKVSAEVRDNRIETSIDSVDLLYNVPHETVSVVNSPTWTPNWSVRDVLSSILGGNATMEPNGPSGSYSQLTTVGTSVGSTPLTTHLNETGLRTVPHLGDEVEKMVHGMVVSLLADRSHLYAATVNSTCNSSHTHNIYHYNAHTLVSVYAATLALAWLMVGLGAIALVQNGVAHDTSFSTFVSSTRNERLDRLFRGACLGKNPLRKELGETKFMFGEQQEPLLAKGATGGGGAVAVGGYQNPEIVVGHATFGTEGEVKRLRKGGKYS